MNVSVASATLELMMRARVITDTSGAPQRITLSVKDADLSFPGHAFPFVDNGESVLVVVTVVRVREQEQAPLAAPKLLIPGKL